ncbi:hypothetical protein JOE11_002486 [Robbsia andropogonis]
MGATLSHGANPSEVYGIARCLIAHTIIDYSSFANDAFARSAIPESYSLHLS